MSKAYIEKHIKRLFSLVPVEDGLPWGTGYRVVTRVNPGSTKKEGATAIPFLTEDLTATSPADYAADLISGLEAGKHPPGSHFWCEVWAEKAGSPKCSTPGLPVPVDPEHGPTDPAATGKPQEAVKLDVEFVQSLRDQLRLSHEREENARKGQLELIMAAKKDAADQLSQARAILVDAVKMMSASIADRKGAAEIAMTAVNQTLSIAETARKLIMGEEEESGGLLGSLAEAFRPGSGKGEEIKELWSRYGEDVKSKLAEYSMKPADRLKYHMMQVYEMWNPALLTKEEMDGAMPRLVEKIGIETIAGSLSEAHLKAALKVIVSKYGAPRLLGLVQELFNELPESQPEGPPES